MRDRVVKERGCKKHAGTYCMHPLCEMSRMGKASETENRSVVSRG